MMTDNELMFVVADLVIVWTALFRGTAEPFLAVPRNAAHRSKLTLGAVRSDEG